MMTITWDRFSLVAGDEHARRWLQRKLTAAYRKADYFARNLRTIRILVDRYTILSGAATGGWQPWKYYDLGEGWCRPPPNELGTEPAFISLTALRDSLHTLPGGAS